MANKKLFSKKILIPTPKADTINDAGGAAYSRISEQKLLQYAVTGTFSDTCYANAEKGLSEISSILGEINPEFIAKVAIYAREKSFMKDLPAFLVAYLSCVKGESADICKNFAAKIFRRVINNAKQLRNYVQFIRSGAFGKTSMSTTPTRLVKDWFYTRTGKQLFKDMIGNDPSLADIIRLCHIRPQTTIQDAMFKYILGYDLTECAFNNLPDIVKEYEAFKKNTTLPVPAVDFRMLASLDIPESTWKKIAENANYHTTRMNLNTFERHGVYNSKEMINKIADKLSDPENVLGNMVFPYQLYSAYKHSNAPVKIKNALQDAADISLSSVPEFSGNIYICVDVSGSMGWPITGRFDVSSKISRVEVASLFSAAILRKNPEAKVILFNTSTKDIELNPRDSLITLTKQMANCSGGTDCSAPLRKINNETGKNDVDLVVMISDDQSWFRRSDITYTSGANGTAVQNEWKQMLINNPRAKLVCIDIAPNLTTQAVSSKNVLNIGGFSDNVFSIIKSFCDGESSWENAVNNIEI